MLIFRYHLNLHTELFLPFNLNDFNDNLKFSEFLIDENGIIQKNLLQKAVTAIILANYANQVFLRVIKTIFFNIKGLDIFIDLSITCKILESRPNASYNEILKGFG